jgi:hypothetical protein
MSAPDASPSPPSFPSSAEEFLFGRLSTEAGRVEEARRERRGFFDLALLEPLDPRPGEPIHLRFRCGVDVSLERLRVFWTCDGTTPTWNERLEGQNPSQTVDARPLAPEWDTLSWGFVQDWGVDLPAQTDGTVIRYVAVGLDRNGKTIHCPWPERDRHPVPQVAVVVVDRLEPPDWFRRAVIYQVVVDRFAPTTGESFAATIDLDRRLGGTLWGLTERLDHLVKLGIDTLWLSPIFMSPHYHGYAVSDFFRVEPALGGEPAWQGLVDGCRRRGLRLVLDFVANHVSDQHAAFVAALASAGAPTRSWFRFRRWPDDYDSFFNQPHQPELDAEQPAVREHLIEAAVHWLGEGCTGFRLDYAHGLSHGFWSQFRAAARAAAPECVCFGEITHTPQVVRSYAGRLDGCLDFALCGLLRETFARGRLPLSAFARELERHYAYFVDSLLLPSFLDNHDMNRFLVVADGDRRRLKVAALVQFTLPGPPLIYYGTEVGLSQNRPLGRLEEARLPMPPREQWDQELRDFYRALIQFRRKAAPCGSVPELLWVDDETRSAAWRIGSLQLMVNCGEDRVFSIGSAVPWFTTFTSDSSPPLGGSLSFPAWSAAVLSHTVR